MFSVYVLTTHYGELMLMIAILFFVLDCVYACAKLSLSLRLCGKL